MRILVSKPDALGDQLIAAGFVQALRRRWPDARIVWHVRSGMEVIASIVGDSSIFPVNVTNDPAAESKRLWDETHTPIVVLPYTIHPYADWAPGLADRFAWWGRFLAAGSWDMALAPVVNRTGLSDFTVTATGAARRIAFSTNGACQPMIEAAFTHLPKKKPVFTTEVLSSLHESEWAQHARLLAAIAPEESLCLPSLRLRTEVASEAKEMLGSVSRLVLVAPGVGQNTQRAWPMERFLRIAGDLRSRGCDVRWIEGPHDAVFFEQLPVAESASRLKLDASRLDLLAALLREAQLLLCNDTAYVHLAAALDTPTVALYGAGQKDRFAPRFGRVRVVQGDPVCRGCQWQCAFDRMVCIQEIPYSAVWEAVEAQLAAPAAAHARISIALPFPETRNSEEQLERVRDWFQEELDRLRWDGWARLQIINDVIERLKHRDQRIAALSAERDALAATLHEKSTGIAHPIGRATLPKLSIIIPMGRPERAHGTLQSLSNQSLRPDSWEVIVVGVGASQLPPNYPQLPLIPVDLERNVLPPRTRAEGVRRATGEWYLFVDDDVQLAPDFFEMLARILAIAPSPATQNELPVGAIGVRLPGGRGTYFEHLTDISNFWSQQSSIRAVPHSVWFLYSAAIVVRAEAYLKSGGFNPELPNGEDVDLTQRIKAAGYILSYEPSLVAHHHHGRDSLFRMWRYFWRNGNTAQYFFAQLGGVCCYSIRTVLTRTWLNLRMNRNFQRTQHVRLGARIPWILLNYLILESSLEWHWQNYLWKSKRHCELPARTRSDRNAAKAFADFEQGRIIRGVARYALAMLQNVTDPVRR